MNFQNNVSLKPYNTFRVDVNSKYFIEVDSQEQIINAIHQYEGKDILILGSGSNILFRNHYNGLVIKNNIRSINLINETKDTVCIEVGAGENWHQFVKYCIRHNWYGIENLSLIPGTVGASPIQNIGAYGVEVKHFISQVKYYDFSSKTVKTISNKACKFEYRSSLFKTNLKGTFAILSVSFKLNKSFNPNINYSPLDILFKNKTRFTATDLSNTIITIREKKLPNPEVIGNAGSFFKNPIITESILKKLSTRYEDIPSFKISRNNYKIPAAWLIEKCEWRGKIVGEVGIYKHQPLVIYNVNNKALGEDIYKVSSDIIHSVKKKFDIILEREVNIIP